MKEQKIREILKAVIIEVSYCGRKEAFDNKIFENMFGRDIDQALSQLSALNKIDEGKLISKLEEIEKLAPPVLLPEWKEYYGRLSTWLYELKKGG